MFRVKVYGSGCSGCSGCPGGVSGGVLGVFRACGSLCLVRVQGVQCGVLGVVVGFNFGFGRTETTRNATWGSILTACRKNVF